MQLSQRQREILKQMGVQTWSLRSSLQLEEAVDEVAVVEETVSADNNHTEHSTPTEVQVAKADLPIEDTHTTNAGTESESGELIDEFNQEPEFSDLLNDGDWGKLQLQVSQCQQCELHRSRTQTVFGVGNENADWMVIGEAPGADEDKQGEPFVGRAGQLLNNMLKAIGLSREQVFIANILKCRPPNNRDPRPEEIMCCENYLRQQIEMIQPKIILAVGRIAAQNLLKVDTPIGKMRGQKYLLMGTKIPVVVTYHPAYLLRSPREKRKSWQDLCDAMKIYQEQS